MQKIPFDLGAANIPSGRREGAGERRPLSLPLMDVGREKVRMQSPVIISSSLMKSPRQRAEDGSGAAAEAQPGMAPCLTTEENGRGKGGGEPRGRKKKKKVCFFIAFSRRKKSANVQRWCCKATEMFTFQKDGISSRLDAIQEPPPPSPPSFISVQHNTPPSSNGGKDLIQLQLNIFFCCFS